MIDFACKQFDMMDIVKCSLGLTKAEIKVLHFFLDNTKKECSTQELSSKLALDLTTVQRAVKKLHDQKVVYRHQKNLEGGGYVFTYESRSKKNIRERIKEIIRKWSHQVEGHIDRW